MLIEENIYCFHEETISSTTAIYIISKDKFKPWVKQQPEFVQNWVLSSKFKPRPSKFTVIPDDNGKVDFILVIANEKAPIWTLGNCSKSLPSVNYHIVADLEENIDNYILGWALGAYEYKQYKDKKTSISKISISQAGNADQILAIVNGIYLARDLVNAPASDMMPQHIQRQCEKLATKFGSQCLSITGDHLLDENYPSIHAVGRASIHEPRLIEWKWGDPSHPKIALVGKGVSFDSGGLDIKSATGMRLMKKDMGGAAHVIAIASVVMELNIPVHLHVLVPAVENAVSGNAFRPGDVLNSRAGKTIEVDNTDAEGRLILCDALTKACEDEPQLIIDMATLTGAARVALGTEVPAFFSNDSVISEELLTAAQLVNDQIWEMPLHQEYRYMLDSDIADISNCASSGYGGAITAALFLNEFVPETVSWVHFDVMAWNTRARAGRPKGGEAMGLRAIVEFLQSKYLN